MTGVVERKYSRTEFQWKLNQFLSLVDVYYVSSQFLFVGRRWMLCVWPNGHESDHSDFVHINDHSEGYVVLELFLEDWDPPIDVRFSLGIRTAMESTEMCGNGTKTFDGRYDSVCVRVIERSELLRRENDLLPQGVLTLELKLEDGSSGTVLEDASVQATVERNVADVSVQTAVEASVSCGEKSESSEKTGPDRIVEDVAKLWPNGVHTDVLLKVKNAEFKAHRTILAARTPVLGAMFHHETTEKASGEVSIEDCEPEVFEQLLHYVYKGAPSEVTAENASALYVLADKYLVNEVKALCVLCMRDTLCLDTFCDTLTLSLMHREDELVNTVTDFFSRNMIDVLKTVDWQRFMHQHTTWANEILIRSAQLTTARYEKEK